MNTTAITLDGISTEPGCLLSAEIKSSYRLPADHFQAVFLADKPLPFVKELSVNLPDSIVFEGLIDEQSHTISGDGTFTGINARSFAAALIDNEARPSTYYNLNLREAFDLFATPYGFFLSCESNPSLAVYKVAKGVSEYEALEGFCMQALGISPRVRSGKIIEVCKQPIPKRHFTFTGKQSDPCTILSVSFVDSRYSVLSELIVLDLQNGEQAETILKNPDATALAISRRRYFSSADKLSSEKDALNRLVRSGLLSKTIRMTLSGLLPVSLYDRVTLHNSAFGTQGDLGVFEYTQKITAKDFTTELLLFDYTHFSKI